MYVGAGTDYCTAIMAHLVARSGNVTAIGLDPLLAPRTQEYLASNPNVQVVCGNGAVIPFDSASDDEPGLHVQ